MYSHPLSLLDAFSICFDSAGVELCLVVWWNSHSLIALARLGGSSTEMRARSICAMSALSGRPRCSASSRRASQKSGSRLIDVWWPAIVPLRLRSDEHTSELQSLMRPSYAVSCLSTKRTQTRNGLTQTQ